jgi:hypothetical protein
MKTIKWALPVLVLLAFSLILSGCPGKRMMSGGSSMEQGEMMEKGEMMDK